MLRCCLRYSFDVLFIRLSALLAGALPSARADSYPRSLIEYRYGSFAFFLKNCKLCLCPQLLRIILQRRGFGVEELVCL